MWRARCFAVTAAASVLAACGESELDSAELEREIASGVEEQTGTRDVEIDCPEGIEQSAGDTFECDATAPGGIRAKITATQVDDDGNVEWELVRP